ncbi:MAG: two-component regulator propeller domain-containing protein, partial [Bacteroidia bacterium]
MPKLPALILSILFYGNIWAQSTKQFRFNNFGYDNGLDAQIIYNATQDKKGQMWFATISGLYGYDNKYFKHYVNQNSSNEKNINNLLYSTYYDSKTDRIWCASLNHFLLFNTNTKEYEEPRFKSKSMDMLSGNAIYDFYRDKQQRMWVCSGSKYWGIYNEANGEIDFYSLPRSEKETYLKRFCETAQGQLWAISSDGLIDLSKGKNEIKIYKNNKLNNFSAIKYDTSQHCFWLSTIGQGLFQFNISNQKFTHYPYTSFYEGKLLNNGIFYSMGWVNKEELLVEGSM